MTLTYAAERRLRRSPPVTLDYDDSLVPGQIVASVMHLPSIGTHAAYVAAVAAVDDGIRCLTR